MDDADINSLVQEPYPLALVVCDSVWRDPYNGKMTIIGTFSTIRGVSLPVRHPIISVYAAMTDGIGGSKIRIQLVDGVKHSHPIFFFESEYPGRNPKVVDEFAYQVTDVRFDKFGEFKLQLLVNGDVAMERSLLVIGPEETQ